MWTVTVILPYGLRFDITPQRLVLAGASLAVALLFGLYVMLLHHSVERGEKLRTEQRRVATQPAEKAVHYSTVSRATTAATK